VETLHRQSVARPHAQSQRIPNSGWITFHIHNEEDLKHALWLMRLSHLRYALKTAADPSKLLEQESEQLHLSPQ